MGVNRSSLSQQNPIIPCSMAANVIGIGHQNIIKVQCDDDGRMMPNRLEEEIAFARQEGFNPLCVVATAATTVRGAYDDLEARNHRSS